jgi:hypothetical protein
VPPRRAMSGTGGLNRCWRMTMDVPLLPPLLGCERTGDDRGGGDGHIDNACTG